MRRIPGTTPDLSADVRPSRATGLCAQGRAGRGQGGGSRLRRVGSALGVARPVSRSRALRVAARQPWRAALDREPRRPCRHAVRRRGEASRRPSGSGRPTRTQVAPRDQQVQDEQHEQRGGVEHDSGVRKQRAAAGAGGSGSGVAGAGGVPGCGSGVVLPGRGARPGAGGAGGRGEGGVRGLPGAGGVPGRGAGPDPVRDRRRPDRERTPPPAHPRQSRPPASGRDGLPAEAAEALADGPGRGWTSRQRAAVGRVLLAAGCPTSQVARACGVSERTVDRWAAPPRAGHRHRRPTQDSRETPRGGTDSRCEPSRRAGRGRGARRPPGSPPDLHGTSRPDRHTSTGKDIETR